MFSFSKSGQQQFTREEREQCRQKKKELELADKRLPDKEAVIKVILVGNAGIGKTSLIRKFVDDKADVRAVPATMFCDFKHCTLHLRGQNVKLRIIDTGGQERFHDNNLTSSFYRNSHGVMLVFAVDDLDSFNSLPRWLKRARENVGPDCNFDCCIVGNKSDRSEHRSVTRRQAENFAHEQGFSYIETSALDMVNVEKAFTDLALAVIKRNDIVRSISAPSHDAAASGRLVKLGRSFSDMSASGNIGSTCCN